MVKKNEGGMKLIHVVPLETPGVVEFRAWEKAQWLWVWPKPFNGKTDIPHLVFLDCPGGRQVTWRMLFLEGQAELPIDENEDWAPLSGLGFRTRRSFGTLWMSQHCYAKANELKRGSLKARTVETKPVHEPEIKLEEEAEAYLP